MSMARRAAAKATKVNRTTETPSNLLEKLIRILVVVLFILVFIPDVNPARIFEGGEVYSEEKKAYLSQEGKMNVNLALFTSATDYASTINHLDEDLKPNIPVRNAEGKREKVALFTETPFRTLHIGALLSLIGIVVACVGACASLGNRRMRLWAYHGSLLGSSLLLGGLGTIYAAYRQIEQRLTWAVENLPSGSVDLAEFNQKIPLGLWIFAAIGIAVLLFSLVSLTVCFVKYSVAREQNQRMEMPEKYRLFLMMLPVLVLAFMFCYLPIYGWRYAFFELVPGDYTLTANKFVGFEQFKYLFMNGGDTLRVLRNTLVMSGLGIITSWLPIAFAVLLAEVPSSKFQRFVQTFTTIPNFISWVLVYAVALALFSKDGFLNQIIGIVSGQRPDTIYLQSGDLIWLKMLLWGTWKGLGWSAIIYIAGIAGIDQQLYEAARVDGANRWHCIWHVTIPGLLPTYMVMLLMSIAGILSNGMEQYMVFSNAWNKETIEVLDLYVYNIGMGSSSNLPLATVVGVTKSLVGVTLLLVANRVSKAIRGESIV